MSDMTLGELATITDDLEAREIQDGAGNSTTWQSASRTDLGRVRHINEDSFLDSPEQRLWVVADGMGGHSRGDYASGAVVNKLQTFARQGSLLANLQDLESRIQAANEQCRNAFRNKQPGTTVAAMFTHGGYCFCLWAGDSRVYRLRNQELEQLTTDHSVAQRKLANGELTEEEAATHKSAHVLTSAVGIREQVELDLIHSQAQPGDRYLLCSDGLYNPMAFADIESLLSKGTPEEASAALVDLALERGGPDNITLIVVDATSPD